MKIASPYKADDEVVPSPSAKGLDEPPSAEGGAKKPSPYPERDIDKVEEKYAFWRGFGRQRHSASCR